MPRRRPTIVLGLCLSVGGTSAPAALMGEPLVSRSYSTAPSAPAEILPALLTPLDLLDRETRSLWLPPSVASPDDRTYEQQADGLLPGLRAPGLPAAAPENVPAARPGKPDHQPRSAAEVAADVERALVHELDAPSLDGGGGEYDGSVARAGSLLEPPATFPLSGGAAERSVHSITFQDGRFLINGQAARRFRPARRDGGLVKETLIHPDDPGLLVKVYYSRTSLGAFESKSAVVRGLEPFAAAGASAALVEHGETPVAALGRVYFYVQELISGVKLSDLGPEARSRDEVGRLFDALARIGVALAVPAADREWLASHVMLGETRSGGRGAYLLGGATRPAKPEEMEPYYEMIKTMLKPGAAGGPAEGERLQAMGGGLLQVIVAPAKDKSLKKILERHGVLARSVLEPGSPPYALLDFDDPAQAARAVAGLLADAEVERLGVHPAVKAAVEKEKTRDVQARPESRSEFRSP